LLKVLEIDIQFQGRWAGHEAGQFAFVTLHADEGAHPYTISSDWRNDGRLTFIIKALGDYTRTLAHRTRVGDVVKVEGPLRALQLPWHAAAPDMGGRGHWHHPVCGAHESAGKTRRRQSH
jgi:predicted ferric reductase